MIAFITAADTELLSVEAAAKLLPKDFPQVATYSSQKLQTEEEIAAWLAKNGAETKIFVVRVLGGRTLFEEGFNQIEEFCRREKRLLLALPGDRQPDPELASMSNVPLEDLAAAFEYVLAGGTENYKNLLLFLADVYLSTAYGFAAPVETAEEGLYHQNATDLNSVAKMNLEEFRREFWRENRPAVSVLFYRALWQSGNLAAVDALLEELERIGCNVLPVFCYSLREESAQTDGVPNVFTKYFSENGEATIDCIVNTLSYAMADLSREERVTESVGAAVEFADRLGIPVVQAIATSQTVQEWMENEAGLSPLDAATKVVLPEFDGRIIGGVYSFKEASGANSTEDVASSRVVSLNDRTEAVAGLAKRHAILKRKDNSEKRICLMLTNFANRHGRVGSAVGLDTPASIINLLKELKTRGYETGDYTPETGDELMERLIAAGGYDKEFLTENQMQTATAQFSAARYGDWFGRFPEAVRTALARNWEEPPGKHYRNNGTVYVAGLQFGNIFVMIQPPRGFGENPLTVYHSGDLVPTHQYLGAYRWLRDEFKADAIIQCGKHGTLEWLPGKGLGLSGECYPEIGISDIPIFYPFIINDPGEGTQAKRRIHACIIDHLVPPMTQAETYDELAQLQNLLGTYANAERIDPAKLPMIQAEIWKTVVAANLHHDLGLEEQPDDEEYGEFLQHIDGYLCEISDMQIRDGLHVLGEMPKNEQLVGLALALLRLDAPGITGLRRAISEDANLDYENISRTETLGAKYENELPVFWKYLPNDLSSRTNGDVLKGIETLAHTFIEQLAADDFQTAETANVLESFDLRADGQTAKTLAFLTDSIVPNLNRTQEEISNLLDGLEGRAVPAGPSGAPTRGMANILPTGRNFYSVDVRAVPSNFAWQVGCKLGDDLLEKYLAKENQYPESIGISVWGTSNMRTQGDDIAEILWLLGVRPVWQEESRRVVDLEIISLAELKRPRIDMVVRMSGFFRDAFPNVVKLLDKAINTVADLDEPDEQNFVRRRVRAQEKQLTESGLSEKEARTKARYRLFSNKPGAYGTGILKAISEQNWETSDDLAKIYLECGGYAYTNKTYGEPAHDEFKNCLSNAKIAVHNQDNREHDIFDSDDYMQFHGGMIAAIRSITGKNPVAMFGDSSNPEQARVRPIAEEARRVFRARVANPKWLRSIQRHGYKGALEMAATIDYLFGYDATAEVVEDWMYEEVAQKYVFDEASRQFLEQSNPWAMREMTERLLEAATRGMWQEPNAETLEKLRASYLATEGLLEAKSE